MKQTIKELTTSLQLGVQSSASKLREWEKLLKNGNRIHLTGTGDELFHDILEQENCFIASIRNVPQCSAMTFLPREKFNLHSHQRPCGGVALSLGDSLLNDGFLVRYANIGKWKNVTV